MPPEGIINLFFIISYNLEVDHMGLQIYAGKGFDTQKAERFF